MDEKGADKEAIDEINAGREIPIVVQQVKFLNNIVAQDHRAIKRETIPIRNRTLFGSPETSLPESNSRACFAKESA